MKPSFKTLGMSECSVLPLNPVTRSPESSTPFQCALLLFRTLHLSLFACSTPFQMGTRRSLQRPDEPRASARPGNLPRRVVALCCGMRRRHSVASLFVFPLEVQDSSVRHISSGFYPSRRLEIPIITSLIIQTAAQSIFQVYLFLATSPSAGSTQIHHHVERQVFFANQVVLRKRTHSFIVRSLWTYLIPNQHECNYGPLSCTLDVACPSCYHPRCTACEKVRMTYSSRH